MNWKKLFSNLLWIAAPVFLAWYFLFPVSLEKAMPAGEGIRIDVLERNDTGTPVQTTYYLPAGTEAEISFRELLGKYPCHRTVNPNGKTTDQANTVLHTFLIQTDSATDFLYTHGGSMVTLNDSYLRMGWFNSKQSTAFAAGMLDILTQTDSGVVIEAVQATDPPGWES